MPSDAPQIVAWAVYSRETDELMVLSETKPVHKNWYEKARVIPLFAHPVITAASPHCDGCDRPDLCDVILRGTGPCQANAGVGRIMSDLYEKMEWERNRLHEECRALRVECDALKQEREAVLWITENYTDMENVEHAVDLMHAIIQEFRSHGQFQPTPQSAVPSLVSPDQTQESK